MSLKFTYEIQTCCTWRSYFHILNIIRGGFSFTRYVRASERQSYVAALYWRVPGFNTKEKTMQTHGVTVRELRVLRGPNIWAYMPALQIIMDIGPYEEQPSREFPGMVGMTCTDGTYINKKLF